MNIKWVQSRSSKKKEKNKEQSFLRWYEDGTPNKGYKNIEVSIITGLHPQTVSKVKGMI
ncbi:hypothetical protein OAH70_06695 [Flavobacteriaceae bacterium]|nr:hypothetical protein [Flavobacteriaceae bacterium]